LTTPRRRPGACVLTYHSVGGLPAGIDAATFERHLEYLSERYDIVLLRDLREGQGRDRARPLVCLTFDDGYRDNVDVAVPLLERFGLRATFFLPTGFLGGVFVTSARVRHPVMDWSQARDLHQAGHEVGAHTITHPRLTELPGSEAWREIAGSKAALETALDCEVVSFAYPKGDYSRKVASLAAAAGFRIAVTIGEGALPESPDWLALPRISARPGDSLLQFRHRLHPGFERYVRLLHRLQRAQPQAVPPHPVRAQQCLG